MKKEILDFVELENGEVVKFSDIKKITKHYHSKHSDGLEPFTKIKKGECIFKLFGIPIKFAKKDCFKLNSCCDSYGYWYNKYYYSLEDLFKVMMEHWGEQSDGAFGGYSPLPNAEYCAGWFLTQNKDALYFDSKKNAICVKPYVTLWFDDFKEYFSGIYGHVKPRRKFITFTNDEELDEWMQRHTNLLKL